MSDINYVDTETEEELIAEGRKWLLIAGIVLAAVNAAAFLSAFVPHSVTDIIAAAGSSVGTVCGVILAAGTRHCSRQGPRCSHWTARSDRACRLCKNSAQMR